MSTMRKTLATIAGVAALAGAAGAATAAPAAPAPGDSGTRATQVAPAQEARADWVPAPTCVHASAWQTFWLDYARATNRCGETVRIKIIWAWADDTACYSIGDGGSLNSSRSRAWVDPRFDGVALC